MPTIQRTCGEMWDSTAVWSRGIAANNS